MGDRGCNLECVKNKDQKGGDVKEFVGQVKIILIDVPKGVYYRKRCNAALILLAQMLMAFTSLLLIFYSTIYSREHWFMALHVFLCTVGLQLCIPTGILTLNPMHGPAVPMKMKDRRSEHMFIQIFGTVCASAGTVTSVFFSRLFTTHAFIGMSASFLTTLSGILGLYVYIFMSETEHLGAMSSFYYKCHKIVGTLAFLTSSASFVSGVIKLPYKNWLPLEEMFYATIIFCVFYSLVVIYKPIKELF